MAEDPWLLYRQTVPDEVRAEIKDMILAAAIDGFDDFLQVTANITASILCGDIHPEVAKEARAYMELALTTMTAKAMQEASRDNKNEGVNARLTAVRKKRGALPAPQPEFTIDLTATPVPAAPWENHSEEE